METITKSFTLYQGNLVKSETLFLYDLGLLKSQDDILKSAATKVSEYRIFAHTYDSMNSLCLRSFSLNELEAEFDIRTKDIRSVTLRDTSVHKKITFNDKGAILTYARGQDTVGKHSEFKEITTKEPISKITINDQSFSVPYDTKEIYEKITGLSLEYLTDEDLEKDKEEANLWSSLLEQKENNVEEEKPNNVG